MKLIALIALFIFAVIAWGKAQFPPAVGLPGSTAIHADSSLIKAWAIRCYVQRGYINIKEKELGSVSYGQAEDALGKADNQVVSLGDSGIATLTFENPICDKPGFDFAVFENPFNDSFLELAFVEISSDSIHWYRFPSVSLTQTNVQVETFGTLNPELIHNLAGKYRVLYGTPFDICDIPDDVYLNKHAVRYVKIIDVVGSIDSAIANFDSQGNIINDPFPTPFSTGGFDLDAIGVIHTCADHIEQTDFETFNLYPNPTSTFILLSSNFSGSYYQVFNSYGLLISEGIINTNQLFIEYLHNGLYFLKILNNNKIYQGKFIKW